MTQDISSASARPKNIRQWFQRDLITIIVPVCVITLAIAVFIASGVKKRVIAKTASLTELLLFNIK